MKLCENCSEEIKGYGKKFCSLSCSTSFNFKGKKRVDRRRECQYCSGIFEYSENGQKYCSRSCAAKFNNRARGTMKYCRECQVECGSGRAFCSDKCKAKYKADRYEKRITGWLNGEIDACMTYTLADWARKYILTQAGYQCEAIDERTGERCTENRRRENGSTILQIDHIDGNWQNCVRENLRALCPTCHALTPTWGSGNMGRGRTWKADYNQYQKK